MSILVSFPGRYGDLIWALPTIRALSRRLDTPIDLLICGEFATLVPLLERQPYLGKVVADARWGMSSGRIPLDDLGVPIPLRTEGTGEYYDQIFHLGYPGWPEKALPYETLHTFNCANQFSHRIELGVHPIPDSELDLSTPWITNLPPAPPTEIAVGFSECHFELKVGLVTLLSRMYRSMLVLNHDSRTRWAMERPRGGYPLEGPSPWVEQAGIIRNADVFLGCNSGLHVLAVAVGTPVVVVEPMEARWNPIFFPLGMDGPQVTVVKGNDGKPTFDARAVRVALERALGV